MPSALAGDVCPQARANVREREEAQQREEKTQRRCGAVDEAKRRVERVMKKTHSRNIATSGEPRDDRRTKPSSRLTRWIVAPLVALSLVTAFGACGGGSSTGTVVFDSIPECESYEAAYRACTANLGARAATATERHVASMHSDVAAAVVDPAERAKRRESCISGMSLLARACR